LNRFSRNRPRLRLEPEAYRELSREVLARDGWRCQDCGTAQHLQVHHLRSRSRLGDDAEENLITLCAGCHRARQLRCRSL
jgi:5-methylcytosine-specific restriction endonuclease McrA